MKRNSMLDRLGEFAKSPQAQQAVQKVTAKAQQLARSPQAQQAMQKVTAKAQQLASDPKNRQRIEDARRRFMGGRGGPGDGTNRPY